MSAAANAVRDAVPEALRTAGWLVLTIDSLRLALPQREVRLIELVADLQPVAIEDGPAIGWLLHKDADPWPAYCLDGELLLQRPVPAARRICVFIEAGGLVTGIACDRVQSLATDAELTVEPVPGCMTGIRSPITGFARYQADITAVLSVTALAAYLAFLQEHGHAAHE
jgi:hypothetical protein